ncbi:hypothetical protein [Dyella silvatica]|uniref:hypothetical protein n=1 Tax=Dyella silvatica TaxID=2992128 RepID=UPI00225664B4|nr:hypothetical protein [Dyella silvatica]
MTRPMFRTAILFSAWLGAWLMATPSQAEEDATDFTGIFAPTDEVEPVIKIVREHGQLMVYLQQDDEACGWLPLIDAHGQAEQARLADRAELTQWLGRPAPEQVQAIVIDGWGVMYHAPKGWRRDRDFATQSGIFVSFMPAAKGTSSASDFHKVSLASVCR